MIFARKVNFILKQIIRHEYFLLGIFAFSLSVFLFAPYLFGGKIFVSGDSDALYYYYPMFKFYGETLHVGGNILWNPYLFSGFPTYLSQSAGFLDPLNLVLFRVFDYLDAFHIRLAFDAFLVILFSYMTARALGVSKLSSFLVGPGYLLAFHARFLSNPIILNTLFLLPLLIYGAVRYEQSKKLRYLFLAGLGAGWAFLSGYAQIVIYALVLFGLYLLVASILNNFSFSKKDIVGHFKSILVPFLIVVSLAGIIGLPQILPALNFVEFTARADGLSYSDMVLKSVGPGDLFLFELPDYVYIPYVTSGRVPLYVGPALFIGAIIAFLFLARRFRDVLTDKKVRSVFIIAFIFLFAFLASLKWSPIFYLMHFLPIFDYFRFPFRWMYLGSFLLALLGAFGLDLLPEILEKMSKRIVQFFIYGVFVFIAFLSIFYLGGSSFQSFVGQVLSPVVSVVHNYFNLPKSLDHYQEALGRGLSAFGEYMSLADIKIFLPVFLLFVATLTVFLASRSKISILKAKYVLAGISVFTFFSISSVQWRDVALPVSILKMEENVLGGIVPIDAKSLYRIYPFLTTEKFTELIPPAYKLSDAEQNIITSTQLAGGYPDMHIYGGYLSIDGYDVFVSNDMAFALTKLGSVYGGKGSDFSIQERIALLKENIDILSLLGGRYVLSGFMLSDGNLKLLGEAKIPNNPLSFYVYKNSRALTRVYPALESVFINHSSLQSLISEGLHDFTKRTYIDCNNCKIGSAPEKFIIRRLDSGNVEVFVSGSKSSFVVFSETFIPGWRVLVDGEEKSLHRTNGLFMAVEVEEGEHTVSFHYAGIINESDFISAFSRFFTWQNQYLKQ